MIASQPTQGALIDGRYQLVDRLGSSTRGESWRALDNRFGQRPVVVRFHRDTDLEASALLDAEIHRIPSLQSSNVATVIDIGNGPHGRYLVREWVDGRSLHEWIESQRMSGRAPEISAVRRIFDQLSSGVAAVHGLPGGAPISHRAIKPTNVILRNGPTGEPIAVLTDVGTSAPSRQPASLTAGNDPASAYLSPEQWSGSAHEVSPATDVFALAVLLTQMLTLRNSAPNNDRWCTASMSFGGALRDMLAQMRMDVPGRLWDVLAGCLRPDVQGRPRDASALRAQLDPAWGGPFVSPMSAPGGVASTQAMDMSQYLNTLAAPPMGGPMGAPMGGPMFGAPPGGAYASTTTVGPYRPMPGPPPPMRSNSNTGIFVLFGILFAGLVMSGGAAFMLFRAAPTSPPPPPTVQVNAAALPPMADSDIVPVGNSPVLGRNDALVTLVMFSDFQCPFCGRVEQTLTQLRSEFGPDLRIVWKNNPLAFHVNARPAAEAAMEVYAEGGSDAFWRFHDLAFQNQQSLNRTSYELWAQQIGVNPQRFAVGLDSHAQSLPISADMALAQRLSATGTPTFFINGTLLTGAQPIDRFRDIIQRTLVRARTITPREQVYARMTANPVDAGSARPTVDPNRIYTVRPNVTAPYRGGRTAAVVLDHFSDLQCPFCARVNPTLQALQAIYGDRIRIVWRDSPLSFHVNAMIAAEAAHEVFLQLGNDAFWRYHDTILANQRELSRANLERWAMREGVDMNRFRIALNAHIHRAAIQSDIDAFTASGASVATPTTFINGSMVSGAVPLATFQARIDAALARVGTHR